MLPFSRAAALLYANDAKAYRVQAICIQVNAAAHVSPIVSEIRTQCKQSVQRNCFVRLLCIPFMLQPMHMQNRLSSL